MGEGKEATQNSKPSPIHSWLHYASELAPILKVPLSGYVLLPSSSDL